MIQIIAVKPIVISSATTATLSLRTSKNVDVNTLVAQANHCHLAYLFFLA
jgi:hypothetical protein